ncbi:MAG: hypothetical protein LC749_00780, partial [Actinobacteria bacterium]|nr:hypothetical protein [Actinomycetota bacterium]
ARPVAWSSTRMTAPAAPLSRRRLSGARGGVERTHTDLPASTAKSGVLEGISGWQVFAPPGLKFSATIPSMKGEAGPMDKSDAEYFRFMSLDTSVGFYYIKKFR